MTYAVPRPSFLSRTLAIALVAFFGVAMLPLLGSSSIPQVKAGSLQLDGKSMLLSITTAVVAPTPAGNATTDLITTGSNLVSPEVFVLGQPAEDTDGGVLDGLSNATSDYLDSLSNGAGKVADATGATALKDGLANGAGKVADATGVTGLAEATGIDQFFVCPSWGGLACKDWKENAVNGISCLVPGLAIPVMLATLGEYGCLAFVADGLKQTAAWVLSEALQAIVAAMYKEVLQSAIAISHFVLVDLLGNNFAGPFSLNPIVNCDPGSQDCRSVSWFTAQFATMRTIGVWLIMPLILMVAIQSIIKGSLFFLLRAMLVMMPIAVLGTVVITVIAQLLINISNDMSHFLASQTADPRVFGVKFTETLAQMNKASYGFFTVFWLIAMIISMVIIIIELLLREMSIYLIMLFFPLGFASLVYPPLTRLFKRAVSLSLALIFMQPFIVMVVCAGFAAMATSQGDPTTAHAILHAPVTTPDANGNVAATTDTDIDLDLIVHQVILATMIFIAGGFGGFKFLAFTPAGEAIQDRIAHTGNVLGMGDYAAQRLGDFGGKALDRVRSASQGDGTGGGVGSTDGGTPGGQPKQTPDPSHGGKPGHEGPERPGAPAPPASTSTPGQQPRGAPPRAGQQPPGSQGRARGGGPGPGGGSRGGGTGPTGGGTP